LVDDLPEGVTAQVRSDGEKKFVFLMNFTNGKKLVLPESGKAGIELEPFGVKILRS
jgi:beta-galactosidase GanA